MQFARLEPVVAKFLYLNEVTIMAGGPYAGKSRTALKWCHDLASGTETFLGHIPPIPILYCSERGWAFNSEQLLSIGIKSIPDNLKFFCVPDLGEKEGRLFDASPLSYISQTVLKDFSPKIICLDTLGFFQSPSAQRDTNSYGHQRISLLKIRRWAKTHNAAILVLAHAPKQNEKNKYEDPFDKVLGSVAILASTVAASIIERVNENYVRLHLRSHISKLETPRYFRYDSFQEVSPQEALSDDTPLAFVVLGARQKQVLDLIPTDFTPYSDLYHSIKAKLNMSSNNLTNIIADLKRKKQIIISVHPHTDEKIIRKIDPS